MTIAQDIQSLSPSAIVEMFDIDTTNIDGGSLYHFHAGTNGLNQPVVWQGVTYVALPMEASGFDKTVKGTLPRPTITVANVDGIFSSLLAGGDDLVGCKVTRKRTFAKYLDAANFVQANLLKHSQDFTRSEWAKQNCSATFTTDSSPIGDLTATKITRTASGNHNVGQTYVTSANAGATFTFSVWLRAGTMTGDIALRVYDGGGSPVGSEVVTPTEDWQRFSYTLTLGPAPAANVKVYIDPVNDGGAAGDTFYLWGAQLELDAVLSDYQKTAASWNPDADPNQHFPSDIWYVDQKIAENKYIVSWELASAFDLQGVMLPYRQVLENSCSAKYRGPECGYTATNYFDKNDAACSASEDYCAKRLTSCRVRFQNGVLPFGGFPGAIRYG